MRLFNSNGNLISKFIYSPVGAVLALSICIYFIFLNFRTVPFAMDMKDRVEKSEMIYQKNLEKSNKNKEQKKEMESEEGKVRFEKQFFNKLDQDEYVILLHKEKIAEKNEEARTDLNFIDKQTQKIKLWWKNL